MSLHLTHHWTHFRTGSVNSCSSNKHSSLQSTWLFLQVFLWVPNLSTWILLMHLLFQPLWLLCLQLPLLQLLRSHQVLLLCKLMYHFKCFENTIANGKTSWRWLIWKFPTSSSFSICGCLTQRARYYPYFPPEMHLIAGKVLNSLVILQGSMQQGSLPKASALP